MNRKPIKRQISKTSIIFPHLVTVGMIDEYIRKSMPYHAAIASVEVRFVTLDDAEHEALNEACMNECYPSRRSSPTVDPYALDLDLPKLGMKGGAK